MGILTIRLFLVPELDTGALTITSGLDTGILTITSLPVLGLDVWIALQSVLGLERGMLTITSLSVSESCVRSIVSLGGSATKS